MVIFVWVICAALTFVIAWWKDRQRLGLALAGVFATLALLFGVIVSFVGVFGAALIPAKDTRGLTWKKPNGHQRECPWCHEMMPFDGKMCGHCFQRVPPPEQWLGTPPPPPPSER